MIERYIHKSTISIFIFVVSFICSFKIVLAFEDNFTTDPHVSGKWQIQNDNGINFDNPGITLSSNNSPSYPYLKTNTISNSDVYYEIVFQYLTLSDWGVGFSFTDNSPNYPTYLGSMEDYIKYNIFYGFGSKLHFVSSLCPNSSTICPSKWWFIYPNLPPANSYYSNTNSDLSKHTLTVIRQNIGENEYTYEVYIDNNLLITSYPTNRLINSMWIGHPSYLGGSKNWPSLKIYSVRSLPFIPSEFPYFSQSDERWGDIEYDSAETWAGAEKKGIARWGCALTSVAMILKQYDVKTPTGAEVTPDILNNWLKFQPDGYIGQGWVNWLAISRYAHESYNAGKAPKELEYTRGSGIPMTLPSVVNEGGHFVVAYASDSASLSINDPNSESRKSKLFTETYLTNNTYTQSETDLSYFLLIADPVLEVTIKDEAGNQKDIDWQTEYLTDDGGVTPADSITTGLLSKPPSGKYRIHIDRKGSNVGDLKLWLYDNAGNVDQRSLELPYEVNDYEFVFNKENRALNTLTELDLTPPPTPILVSPVSGMRINTNGLVLDWSDVTDPSLPITYYYQSSWQGGTYGPVTTNSNSFINAGGSPERTYKWQVKACDNVNNCSSWSDPNTLIIDNTAPKVDLVFPTPGPSSNYFEAVFSELVNPVEVTNGANYYLENWPGAGGSGDLSGDVNISWNETSKTARILFLNLGWYISPEQKWGVKNISDLAGNQMNPSDYYEYSTTMTAPVLTSTPITTPNPVNTLTQTWSWLSANDTGSGVKGYSFRTLDINSNTYLSTWSWLGNVLGVNTSLAEGNWKLELTATDNAGNVSEVGLSENLLVDVDAPSMPVNLHFDNPSKECGEYTKEKMITIDWDDATDNNAIAGYEYNVDYPLTNGGRGSWTTFFTNSSYRGSLNEGIHYIKLRTKDKAGNYSNWSSSCAITYDSITPTFESKTIFSGWHNTAQTSYFDFLDPNMGSGYLAPTCEITTEGSAVTCSVVPNVCDKALNCYTSQLISNAVQIDLSKPRVGLNAWGSTIDGTAADDLSGVDRVEIRIIRPDKSESIVTAAGTTNWSYTMSDPAHGPYTINVWVWDRAGNKSEEIQKEFVMSNASPNNNSPVLGVNTSHPIPTPHRNKNEGKPLTEDSDHYESPIPKGDQNINHELHKGSVLGEQDTKEENNYWWLIIPIALISLIIYLLARRKRN